MALVPSSGAIVFVDFVGGSFVQVTRFDLLVHEYCPLSWQNVDRRLPIVDFSVGQVAVASKVLPFQPSLLILLEAMLDDDADCLETTVALGIAVAAVVAVVFAAAVVELVVDGTADNFQASDSCSACFDSLECCLRNHWRERCLALMVPSFDAAVGSVSSCAVIDFHA